MSGKRGSLLPGAEEGSLVPGPDKARRSSLLPPGCRQRRRSSARRNSTFDAFMQKGGGRKYSINDEDDEENKLGRDENGKITSVHITIIFLVIKDGRIKPKSTEERAKMPKLKCSLLQDYARSRVTTEEDEEEEDLLVPEKRLNLLMASPSITKRRTSMMPVDSLATGQTQNTTQPKLQDQEGSGTCDLSENDEEELPLLAIPKLLLRRASTQLGLKGLSSTGNKSEQETKNQKCDMEGVIGQHFIMEETEEEMFNEKITVEIVSELPEIVIDQANRKSDFKKASASVEQTEQDEVNVNQPDVMAGFQSSFVTDATSKESLLYVDAESLSVPSYPRANEPPLEFHPYALTRSRNNILYVIAESLAVPKIHFQSRCPELPESGDLMPGTEAPTPAKAECSSLASPAKTGFSSLASPAKAEYSSSSATPVRAGSLSCPWSRPLGDTSSSLPDIVSGARSHDHRDTATSASNSHVMNNIGFSNEMEDTDAKNRNPNAVMSDKNIVSKQNCLDNYDENDISEVSNAPDANGNIDKVLDATKEYNSKSKSSFFLPRSSTVETFIEDVSDFAARDDKQQVSKSLGKNINDLDFNFL